MYNEDEQIWRDYFIEGKRRLGDTLRRGFVFHFELPVVFLVGHSTGRGMDPMDPSPSMP